MDLAPIEIILADLWPTVWRPIPGVFPILLAFATPFSWLQIWVRTPTRQVLFVVKLRALIMDYRLSRKLDWTFSPNAL
jgi:hypothetical protein